MRKVKLYTLRILRWKLICWCKQTLCRIKPTPAIKLQPMFDDIVYYGANSEMERIINKMIKDGLILLLKSPSPDQRP